MITTILTTFSAQAQTNTTCQNGGALLIFARGASARLSPQSAEADRFFRHVGKALGDIPFTNLQLGDQDGDGGTAHGGDGTGWSGVDPGEYPAVGLTDWGLLTGMDGYYNSIWTGISELQNFLNTRYVNGHCKTETAILGGYSEGAEVIGTALSGLSDEARNHIGFVALYGDPRYNSACQKGTSAQWTWGDAGCVEGRLGARQPYVPQELQKRTGSWCDKGDGVCTGSIINLPPLFNTHSGSLNAYIPTQYFQGWIVQSAGYIAAVASTKISQLAQATGSASVVYHQGGVPDGYVVENPDAGNHHYVAAGGRLFWYDRNNAGLEADFIGQMNAKYGTTQPLKMRNADIHAIEANRDNSGNLAPGSHPPADNTFMYERGNSTQYIMQYSRASAISNIDELTFLGGVNRAVMVPAGGIAPFVATPSTLPRPPLGTVLQTIQPSDPDYEYQRDAFGTVELLWADNVSVQACIAVAKNGFPQRVPQSLVNQFLAAGAYHTNKSNCDFGPSRAFYGKEPGGSPGVERWYIFGNNSPIPYTRYQYSSSLSIYCRWGASPANVMIPTAALNNIGTGQPMLHCPNNTYLRNNQTGQVFQWWDGQLHYVPNADVLTCLTMGHPEVVIGLDEPQFGGAPQGTPANCAYEGKMMQAPDGQVFWVKNGQRRYVGNTMIRNCVKVRANAGDPVPVTQQTLNSYPQGDTAFCPYSVDMRFVRGDGQTQVWRVFADGTRQHALGLCDPRSDPRFAVHVVPAGEVDGHRYIGDFSPNPTACAAIP